MEGERLYLVIMCYGCGKLVLVKAGQRTRVCPYCQKRILVEKARKIANVSSSREASEIIQMLKKKLINDFE